MTNVSRVLHRISVGLLLICGFSFTACDLVNGDFVDRDPRGAVSEGQLLGKSEGAEAVLIQAYSALSGLDQSGGSLGEGPPWISAADHHLYGTIAGGLAHKGSTTGDQAQMLVIAKHEHGTTSNFFNALWKSRYEGVSRTNSAISLANQQAEEGTISEETRTRIVGEARFLRGHYYFELKKLFGNVPWVDETTEDPDAQPNTGSNHPDVWQKIEEDFQFAKDNLPVEQSQFGRANRWAAAAYLGKTHLFQEEWQEARTQLTEVITQGANSRGTSYQLTPAFQDMFNAETENNSGTVFDFQATAVDGSGGFSNARGGAVLNWPHGSASPFGCCGFYQPTLWFVNSFRTGDDGLPTLDPSAGESVKNALGVGANEKYSLGDQTLDPRLEWTIGRRGVPFHNWGPHPGALWVRDEVTGGPFHSKKHVFRNGPDNIGNQTSGVSRSPNNYSIIRFADVLLMAAEAEAELENLPQARQYVNRVRNRAGNPESEMTNRLNREFALAVVSSESAMLSTNPSEFDWVVREDRNSTFVFLGGDPSSLENWNEYELPEYNVEPYPSSAFSSKREALKRIRFERKLELGMEGHRFFDIVRWGIADERLDRIYAWESDNLVQNLEGGDFTPDRNELYPIPQRQIELSISPDGEQVLEQNPGYN